MQILKLHKKRVKDGFLATPNMRAPKTTPVPTPAPISPVVANPVPKKAKIIT